jgi:hypothetical protein
MKKRAHGAKKLSFLDVLASWSILIHMSFITKHDGDSTEDGVVVVDENALSVLSFPDEEADMHHPSERA